ncbi:MAG: D-alanyl-D-alanine carboxypeptidase [Alphaproteobacteria bacterium]|nr:D-alanyl-D-alanine carboxypeptidase [Alphaproteobacteria bacterium]
MKNYKKSLAVLLGLIGTTHQANALETKAKYAVLMDYNTGTVFYEKEADVSMAPASMSKLMTAYIIFEKIKEGQISLDDKFTVSTNAWKKGGFKTGSSTMGLEPKQKVKVRDLLRGIIVQSGNDACIVAAENIAGSEEEFAEIANQKAQELGLTHSHFANATGWPNPGQMMSAKDLAKLAYAIIKNYGEYYSIYSEAEFTYNGIRQENRNPLLLTMPGIADGMKTGHTKASGYGLVGSAKKNGRRIIMVVNGLQTIRERSDESRKLILAGFRDYDNYQVVKAGKQIAAASVWMGNRNLVSLITKKDILLTLEKGEQKKISVELKYKSPIKAPIVAGQEVGTLIVYNDGKEVTQTKLYAGESIKNLGFFGRVKAWIKYVVMSIFKK